jgi:tetratricopeptide (TPR) repeat protein
MRHYVGFALSALFVTGCGPPKALHEMHIAYNTGRWAAVTEKFADMGRPRTLDAVAYARVAHAAGQVYTESKSPAYRNLALECYDLAAAKDPVMADEYCAAKGDLLFFSAEAEPALASYRSALQINPRHAHAAVQATRLLLDSGRTAEAVIAAQGLLAPGAPMNAMLLDGLIFMARAEAAQKHRDAALKILQYVGTVGPAEWEPGILYALAECNDAAGENGPARSALRKALTRLPQDAPHRPQFEKYLEQLEAQSQGTAAGPPPEEQQKLAHSPVSTRPAPQTQPPGGSRRVEQPPPRDEVTTKATAMVAQALGLADAGKVDQAIRLLEEAVKLAPKLPAPAAQLAALHVKAGDIAAAKNVLQTAVQNMPDNQVLRQMLDRLKTAAPATQPRG